MVGDLVEKICRWNKLVEERTTHHLFKSMAKFIKMDGEVFEKAKEVVVWVIDNADIYFARLVAEW